MNRRAITLSIAVAITLTSVGMAAVAAVDRGGMLVDQVLLIALSISVTVLVQFLPSLSKNKLTIIVWILCLFAALFNHLNFFVHSAERAELRRETKAEDSIRMLALAERISDVSGEYATITSRSVTDISRDLATTTGWKVRAALKIELNEARRKVTLSNQLAALKQELASIRETSGKDAVTDVISNVTGVSAAAVNVSIGLILALLVELAGAILWYEILHGMATKTQADENSSTSRAKEPGNHSKPILMKVPIPSSVKVESVENTQIAKALVTESKDVNEIILAINNGKCKPTAASIRELLNCRTSRAAELNRLVKARLQTQQFVAQ